MSITLAQFEKIDGLQASILRMGDFETCADPRACISTSNRLLDACIDAIGLDAVNAFASAEECAADITTRALLSADFVVDEITCDCGAPTNGGALTCGSCVAEHRNELPMIVA